ncbi:ABC transporter permease [Streptomyces acidiscabies]|uniref:ABC transporter permease n=1 Tax=Streptomyces acidiscabies TaxID=42234 RepID=A0AAP6EGA4_9ACTN|nr:ABC transporter permease [Streptomyces acidiscabies]MBZ3917907.1 ABC transporter permease [Streptomyces acidiscabies]MDX2961877.1 ABC transporter permease [Streptomyces acidiscabies]MDX3023376.1 ABC transporter permease [Streptomyces acidiscabies]MDX3789418.1 ABC transporter permease [Streptomyces acidiscabies]GAQ50402.1 ABC-2 family transporter protein [Streptomyces acidiscabies]
MTTTITTTAPTPTARRVPLTRAYRFELVKLASQWRIRLLLLACWTAPGLFVAGVSQQSTLPSDTLFGRWMHATAWAGPLVILGFAGTWALPLLTSVVAGDVFAAEDRLGTWRHLLVVVRSPRRVFAAKALAALTVVLLFVAGLAASSTAGGLLTVGDHPLVGLDGHLLTPGDAAGRVLLAWLCALAPTLALAAIGLLGSVALGRSPTGLLLPPLLALAMQVAQMLPLPVAVRLALPGYAFIAWNGLFTSPAQLTPLLIAVTVSLAWAVLATALAYLLFLRRDFTNPVHDGAGRRALTLGLLPLAALTAVTVGAVAAATPATGSGIEQSKVQRSLATAFAHLYRLQTEQLHRPAVTEAQVRASAACTKSDGRGAQEGAGNDWRCVVSWHLPGVPVTGTAVYQLDIGSDGRYVADGDGPKEVNGYFLLRTPTGDAPNPLWQFDGNVELLDTTSKG